MRSNVLLETTDLTLGEFECGPGDPLWREVNENIDARPHVVFPRTRVLITQDGARPTLCTPNHVVFYRPNQRYRRALRDGDGDRCLWLALRGGDVPPAVTGPADARTYLLAVALSAHLRRECEPDRLVAEEAAVRLLDRAVGGPRPVRRPRRARTDAEHAELAEAAKELLSARMTERLSLESVAHALSVSRFHLARVFRARTGYSLGDYVHGLRLRAAVEHLHAEPDAELSRLALDLGYCSPSHFTDRFRAAFGVPPSQARTIMEAGLVARA